MPPLQLPAKASAALASRNSDFHPTLSSRCLRAGRQEIRGVDIVISTRRGLAMAASGEVRRSDVE